MGLTVKAKKLSYKDSYDCGYFTFMAFRVNLAKTFNKEFGEIYDKWIHGSVTDKEFNRMNEILTNSEKGNIASFLTHSDCDGEFSAKECGEIYEAIKDLKMDMLGHNYDVMEDYNMLEQWKNIFKHCYDNKVILEFC